LIAVEPSKGMRDGWEKKIGEVEGLESSGVKIGIQDGLFDKIPVEDGKADLVSPFISSSRVEEGHS